MADGEDIVLTSNSGDFELVTGDYDGFDKLW